MQVAEAMEILGERKRFHAIVFLLLALNFMFIPIHIFVDLFLSYEPHHYCAFPPGGSKYAWIPYNHATHEFYQCAIYDTPLTKEQEMAEKQRIEEDAYRKDIKVWDWKYLKFKSKKHTYGTHYEEHDDEDIHDDRHDDQTSANKSSYSAEKHRRKREQARPPPSDKLAGDSPPQHRYVNEDGELVEGPEAVPYDVGDSTTEKPTDPGRGEEVTDDDDADETKAVDDGAKNTEQEQIAEDVEGSVAAEAGDSVGNATDAGDKDTEEDSVEGMQSDQPRDGIIVSHWNENGWADDDREESSPQKKKSSRSKVKDHIDNDASTRSDKLELKSRASDRNSDGDSDDDNDGDERSAKDLGDDDDDDDDDDDVKVSASKDRSYKPGATSTSGNRKFLKKVHQCQHGIHYLANVGTTLATEYGLSCKKDVSVITNTVLGTAMVAGAVIFAPFVDKYGRKTLFMMVCCQNCLISLGIACVGDIRSYWVLRFLSRFYIEGVEIAILVLAVEMAPTKSRPIAPLILYVAYAIGQVLLSLQAMLFRSWWKLQLAISVETMLLIPFSWFLVPESIQWLVSMRRHTDAEKLIRLGCRLNGTILPSDFALDREHGDDDSHGHGHVHVDEEATGNGYHGNRPRKSAVERLRSTQLNLKNRPGTGEYLQHEFHAHIGDWRKVIDLMKNRQLRRHFFIVSYMWAIVGFLYYGLTASTMVMKGNVYLNYCLSGLVMIPASVSIFILRRFGRKKPIFYFLIGAGIFIILSVVCPPKLPDGVDMYPVYLAIKLMAKYCVVSCLISIRLLIIELFPTPVRGTLIGLTAFIGLLGSALGYYFLELISFSKWVGVVVGALALLAAILSRLLPETSHRPLPDTINDMMAACREMFLNLLVAMPNVPRPEEPLAPTPSQSRPKRNLSALSAFSAVLSWRSRSKSGDTPAPVRSMSDEDFKRAPHMPLSSMASAPLPRYRGGESSVSPTGPVSMRAFVARAREADAAAQAQQSAGTSPRQTLREKLARALSTRRAERGGERLEVPAEMARRPRRCSSTPSLSPNDKKRLGIDNPQYEPDSADGAEVSTPKVTFDLVRESSPDSPRTSQRSNDTEKEVHHVGDVEKVEAEDDGSVVDDPEESNDVAQLEAPKSVGDDSTTASPSSERIEQSPPSSPLPPPPPSPPPPPPPETLLQDNHLPEDHPETPTKESTNEPNASSASSPSTTSRIEDTPLPSSRSPGEEATSHTDCSPHEISSSFPDAAASFPEVTEAERTTHF